MLAITGGKFVENGKLTSEHIGFIGSSFTFPDMVLRLVQAEFDGIGVQRLETLETMGPFGADNMPRLVLVEDRFAEELELRLDEIRSRFGGAQVVLAYRDREVACRLLALQKTDKRLDGLRFIPVSAPIACWMSMLRILLSGDFVVPGELLEMYSAAPPPGMPESAATANDKLLTEREREVLECVAQGHRNKTIASDLGVSEHTVKLHIHHIITKIGVENRTAAANWYLAQRRPDGPPRQTA